MRRNRLLLCFLLGIAIVFYGVPYLNFQGETSAAVFSGLWLAFALMAIGGNFIALLYGKKVYRNKTSGNSLRMEKKQKVRQYG